MCSFYCSIGMYLKGCKNETERQDMKLHVSSILTEGFKKVKTTAPPNIQLHKFTLQYLYTACYIKVQVVCVSHRLPGRATWAQRRRLGFGPVWRPGGDPWPDSVHEESPPVIYTQKQQWHDSFVTWPVLYMYIQNCTVWVTITWLFRVWFLLKIHCILYMLCIMEG